MPDGPGGGGGVWGEQGEDMTAALLFSVPHSADPLGCSLESLSESISRNQRGCVTAAPHATIHSSCSHTPDHAENTKHGS